MKKKYLCIEFTFVFLILIAPPLFVKEQSVSLFSNTLYFFLYSVFQFCIACFLNFTRKTSCTKTKFESLIKYLQWGSITFGSMMIIYAIMEFLYLLFPSILTEQTEVQSLFSNGAFSFFAITFGLFMSAYYEEILYRQFLPESLHKLIEKKQFYFLIEIVSVLIFGFSHRYLGILAVINAIAVGIVLRICFVKTGNAKTQTVVHFLYNFLLVLVSSLLQ